MEKSCPLAARRALKLEKHHVSNFPLGNLQMHSIVNRLVEIKPGSRFFRLRFMGPAESQKMVIGIDDSVHFLDSPAAFIVLCQGMHL